MDPFDRNTIEHDELATELWSDDKHDKNTGARHVNNEAKPSDIIWVFIGLAIVIIAIIASFD